MAETTPTGLADCAAEPIRTPGAIQPHGWLLVLDPMDCGLLAFSDNQDQPRARSAIGLLDPQRLRSLVPDALPVGLGALVLDGERFDVSAHRTRQHCVVEFEYATDGPGDDAPLYRLTRSFLPRLQRAGELNELARLAAAEMKCLTGFGRCLVYRFDAAGHGEVLAEELDPGYDSYLGHHFPAADIPPQARELYLLNRVRLIADADYTPVPLAALAPELATEAVDLSQAQLRSVSPVHLAYMRNMGTLASMSVSIVIDGRLWGLISCHHHTPRRLSLPLRRACEHLGELLALSIQSNEVTSSARSSLALRQLTLELVAQLSDSDASLQQLVAHPSQLLRLTQSRGAAVVRDDQLWTTGEVPGDDQIQALANWVAGLGVTVYESSALAQHFGQAPIPHAAGVLAISISQVHRHLILWFRPEIVTTVTWAGDPRKAEPGGDGHIHPRASFASWVETVRGRSLPWSAEEVGAVNELRQALIGIVLRRAEEVAEMATELGRVNKELEAFSYTVSHDLRAPMRHIAGYVDLVVDAEGGQLSERARKYLANVKEASVFSGKLVDALLEFSRMSRSALKVRSVNVGVMVEGLVRELSRHERASQVEWQIAPDLPALQADPLLLQVAVRNLMANAVKYSRTRTPPRITIRPVRRADGDGIEVEDNGVGFQMKYVDKLFGVFQRLHAAEEFEGTGIGLANVKRIVERHGGTVYAHGEVGHGARFGFVLPRPAADPHLDSRTGDLLA
ncbi:histidine kinase [Rhodoferax koreense]|uniref:histidine kinase n=1 Tax=Rhodoferax koreensis TaxID=1842727 RepID=A0A1P8K4G8_9BURK|nr:histidine kinase [Rhodoferax koreense]